MKTHTENLLRIACLAAVLTAGSCAAGSNDASMLMADPNVNHPIAVEPSYRDLKVQFAGPVQGMPSEDALRFDAFLADYRAHGNGSIGISVPSGPPSRAAIEYFAERAAATGISRDKILVATHDAPTGDMRVELNFVAYQARLEKKCGDWSENLAFTMSNDTPANFGCAVQQNIAAMIADPRDLMGPRQMGESDGARRATVIDKYRQGEITGANKRKSDLGNEQSGLSTAAQ